MHALKLIAQKSGEQGEPVVGMDGRLYVNGERAAVAATMPTVEGLAQRWEGNAELERHIGELRAVVEEHTRNVAK